MNFYSHNVKASVGEPVCVYESVSICHKAVLYKKAAWIIFGIEASIDVTYTEFKEIRLSPKMTALHSETLSKLCINTRSSAMHDSLVSRNLATTKHPI